MMELFSQLASVDWGLIPRILNLIQNKIMALYRIIKATNNKFWNPIYVIQIKT